MTRMNKILLLPTVLSLISVSISSQSDNNVEMCIDCLYNKSDDLPAPELLYATSTTAVLRSRSCNALCKKQFRWFYFFIKDGYTTIKSKEKNSCFEKDYCTFQDESPGSLMGVYTSLLNPRIQNYTESKVVYVRFCPDWAPPRPAYMECLKRQGKVLLRWPSFNDIDCTTSTQYMVQMIYEKKPMKEWLWLGEAFRRDSEFLSFAGLVRRCEPNSLSLCADLDGNVEHFMTHVKLGVRRIDGDNTNKMMSQSEFTRCYDDTQPKTRYASTDGPPASSSPPNITPPSASQSGNSSTLVHYWRRTRDVWRMMALGTLAALIITIIMLPLAFIAGRRYQGKQESSSTSWRHLSDDGLAARADRRSLPSCSDFPPAYAYDYAVPTTLLSSLPPPLPPNHPPPRKASTQEEPNEMYGLVDASAAALR